MVKNKRLLLITTVVCLLPILFGIAVYDQLPPEIATHFNAQGLPDDYSPKVWAVFGLPIFLAVVNAACHFAIDNDPRKAYDKSIIANISKWIAPVISVLINVFMYVITLGGKDIPVVTLTMGLMGILFIVLGAYMPKCKQSYVIGIKLPWTLDDAGNWEATHKLAGTVWMIGGSVILVAGFFEIFWVLAAAVIVMVLVPSIYSFAYYRKNSSN
jgi:uncharacterized membrane protein